MNINSIQNYNVSSYKNKKENVPSFKRIHISDKYFGPFEKYASNEKRERKNKIVNRLENYKMDLRTKSNCLFPSYIYNDLNKTEAVDWEYYEENCRYTGEKANKYNQMIESLGEQAEDLDVFIAPPPLCQEEHRLYTAYCVPALGIEGKYLDCDSNNNNRILIENPDYHCPYNSYRWLTLPSNKLIEKITKEISGKLNGYLNEGIESNKDKITIPKPSEAYAKRYRNNVEDNDRIAGAAEYEADMIFKARKTPQRSLSYAEEAQRRREIAELDKWLERHRELEEEWEREKFEKEYPGVFGRSGYSGW